MRPPTRQNTPVPDDRLRLIFACCHPELEEKTGVSLTLRSLCRLTTAEVAREFLVAEATMDQRLSRARGRITASGILSALAGLGRADAARAAHDRAIRDAASAKDAAFLARRRGLLPQDRHLPFCQKKGRAFARPKSNREV